jgi:hypothetical protein
MREADLLGGHVPMACECLRDYCLFCRGRLLACTRCGALGTVWPDECPGRQMSMHEVDEINAGRLNYRDETWRGEPSQVAAALRGRWEHGQGPAVCYLPVRGR